MIVGGTPSSPCGGEQDNEGRTRGLVGGREKQKCPDEEDRSSAPMGGTVLDDDDDGLTEEFML